MMYSLYIICQVLIILIAGFIIYFLASTYNQVLQKYRIPAARRKPLVIYTVTGLLFWLSILSWLGHYGFFDDFETLPPKILVAVIPTIIVIGYLLYSKLFLKLLKQVPPARLVRVQSFRIAVEFVLWLGLLGGFVPFQMTFEGFNYDIIVGITAFIAANVFFGKRFYKWQGIIWNVFGIMLLCTIVFISAVSTPSPIRIFMNEPANTFIGQVPFIWIPGFIVPFALAMHLFSIRQLLNR